MRRSFSPGDSSFVVLILCPLFMLTACLSSATIIITVVAVAILWRSITSLIDVFPRRYTISLIDVLPRQYTIFLTDAFLRLEQRLVSGNYCGGGRCSHCCSSRIHSRMVEETPSHMALHLRGVWTQTFSATLDSVTGRSESQQLADSAAESTSKFHLQYQQLEPAASKWELYQLWKPWSHLSIEHERA